MWTYYSKRIIIFHSCLEDVLKVTSLTVQLHWNRASVGYLLVHVDHRILSRIKAVHSFEESLDNTLSKFWEVEPIGSPEENVFDEYKENVEFYGGIYVTKLPFKLHHEILPE